MEEDWSKYWTQEESDRILAEQKALADAAEAKYRRASKIAWGITYAIMSLGVLLNLIGLLMLLRILPTPQLQ